MQYHLNGFRPGNYQVPDAARKPATAPPLTSLPTAVDVLIVGCGPAGLTLARQLAEFADIRTCIVDQRDGPLLFGQADGISCRTMEIMEAFNASEYLVKETYQLHQNAFWEPSRANPAEIERKHKVADARLGLSEFVHGVVNQARLHELLLDGMKDSVAQVIPHYSRRLVGLEIDRTRARDLTAYPITARFEGVGDAATVETVRARYVVGCDGARSAVRRHLAIPLEGDSANKVWGVMDVLLVTDFPDIRVKSFIQSKAHGAVMLVPREGGYLVRLYVELQLLDAGQRASDLSISVEDLIARVSLILRPYTIDIREVAWWSIYEVGQRVAQRFDDTSAQDAHTVPRAFIAGDACHTHSPKGGWGLNTSLPDTFNLGWKLAAVIRDTAHPKLLRTYATERRRVAEQLIEADRQMSALVATHPSATVQGGLKADTAAIEAFIARQNGFIAGTSIEYAPSFICTAHEHQHLAAGFRIGQRFHSAMARRIADGRPQHLGHLIKADGRWRLFIFGGRQHPLDSGSCTYQLIDFLQHSADSPVRRYTRPDEDIDSLVDTYGVFLQQDLSIGAMPDLLWPTKGRLGLRDYEKVFFSDPDDDIYDAREIDRENGCIVVVRPDQHIAAIFPTIAHEALSHFFSQFMVRAQPPVKQFPR